MMYAFDQTDLLDVRHQMHARLVAIECKRFLVPSPLVHDATLVLCWQPIEYLEHDVGRELKARQRHAHVEQVAMHVRPRELL